MPTTPFVDVVPPSENTTEMLYAHGRDVEGRLNVMCSVCLEGGRVGGSRGRLMNPPITVICESGIAESTERLERRPTTVACVPPTEGVKG